MEYNAKPNITAEVPSAVYIPEEKYAKRLVWFFSYSWYIISLGVFFALGFFVALKIISTLIAALVVVVLAGLFVWLTRFIRKYLLLKYSMIMDAETGELVELGGVKRDDFNFDKFSKDVG